MPHPRLALLALALLAACGTPQEQCIARQGQELRTLQALARETRANLARGYGIEERQEVSEIRRRCDTVNAEGETVTIRCDEVEVDNVRVPVALDLAAERQKLAQLESRIARERARVAAAADACRQAYPE